MTEHGISRALRLGGYGVTVAADGAEAIGLLQSDMPDVLVINTSDLGSPQDSRELRELVLGARVPMVLIGQNVSAWRLVHGGAVCFAHSGEPREVLSCIREALSLSPMAA